MSEVDNIPANHKHRTEFTARLRAALERAGHRISPTVLSRLFNGAYTGAPITVHAARKWLVGEAVPTHEKMKVLAQLLHTTPNALAWGEDQDIDTSTIVPPDLHLTFQIRALSVRDQELVAAFVGMLTKHRQHDLKGAQ